ncbi:hypothetical protein V6N13_009200 [Hibiscus sabdariffa]
MASSSGDEQQDKYRRTKIWPPGSLEEKVQNLVKTWEIEMFHKLSSCNYKSVKLDTYTTNINGMKPLTIEEKRRIGGGYNNFMQTSLPEELRGYDPTQETADTSHVAFTTAFCRIL